MHHNHNNHTHNDNDSKWIFFRDAQLKSYRHKITCGDQETKSIKYTRTSLSPGTIKILNINCVLLQKLLTVNEKEHFLVDFVTVGS